MAIFKHVGIRPLTPLAVIKRDGRKKDYILEPATGKYWSKRELSSGCDEVLEDIRVMEVEGDILYYCTHCEEWFHNKQFEVVE